MKSIDVRFTGAEDYNDHLSYLIAGPPGKGKTRFAATAKDPYLLNAEAGTMSIASKHIPTTEIDSSETLLAVRKILALGPEKAEEVLGFPVGTVIIDTFDEISRIVIHERLQHEKKDVMGPGDWPWLSDQLGAIIRGFQALEMNVIFTSHVKDQQVDDTVYYKLDISGATAHQLPAAVDEAFILNDRVVAEYIDGVESSVRKQYLFTAPSAKYEWVKDHSGELDEIIELNFEDDFQRVVAKIRAGGANLKSGETRTIEISGEDTEEDVPEPEPEVEPITTESATKAITDAEIVIAAAEENKRKKQTGDRPTATESSSPTEETAAVSSDIESAKNGDMITIEGAPAGFQLNAQMKVLQAKGIRFVYEVGGDKVISRNQLQRGVKPQPSTLDTGIFCQVTGKEITPEEANISRIRYRKVLCEDEFSNLLTAGKVNK